MVIIDQLPREPIPCEYCNEIIKKPSKGQIYCTTNCRKLAHNERLRKKTKLKPEKIYSRPCDHCGKTMKSNNARRRYCDPECKKLFEKQRDSDRREENKKKKGSEKIDPYFLSR